MGWHVLFVKQTVLIIVYKSLILILAHCSIDPDKRVTGYLSIIMLQIVTLLCNCYNTHIICGK